MEHAKFDRFETQFSKDRMKYAMEFWKNVSQRMDLSRY